VGDEQLDRIEARLKQIEDRLNEVEGKLAPPPPPSATQPRYRWTMPPGKEPKRELISRPPIPPPVRVGPAQTAAIVPPYPPDPPKSDADKVAAEYKIGAQVLPRVGAAVFLLGLLYLVILATSRGLITPPMQWAGELTLCGTFIIVGLVKRNEREDFGQVLIGIGSCGLYLSFGGAEAYKHLITGNTLVVSYMALSIATLGFSWWRSSRSFWVIGILGGLVGALLPLSEHNLLMNGVLQLCIVAIAAVVAGKRQWYPFTVILFMAAMCAACAALFPIYGDEWQQIGFLYVDALICLAAMAYTYAPSEADTDSLWLSFAVFGVGILGLIVRDGLKGTVHLAIFSATIAVLALPFSGKPLPRNRLLMGASAVLLLLCPYGLAQNSFLTYTLLCLAMCFLAWKAPSRKTLSLVWAEIGFAVGGYLVFDGWEKPWNVEASLMALIALAALAAGWVSRARSIWSQDQKGLATFWAAAVSTIALLRCGYLVGLHLDPLHRPFLTQVYTASILSYACGMILLFRRANFLRNWAWCLATYAFLCYSSFLSYATVTHDEFCVLLVFAGLTLLLTKANLRDSEQPVLSRVMAMTILGAMALRAGYGVGLPLDPKHRSEVPLFYTATLLSLACGLLSRYRRTWVETTFMWLLGFLAAFFYFSLMVDHWPVPFADEMPMLLFMALIVYLATKESLKLSAREGPMAVAAILLWAISSRAVFITLTISQIGLREDGALSVAWTLYAFILIGIGFVKKAPILRYMALTLFAMTLAKVFLVDLASLDAGLRVGVLMALGVAMIGGGYWYIQARRRLQ